MKQKILKLVMLGLIVLCGNGMAWADDNTTSSVYCPLTNAYYDDILSAYNAIKDNAATELEIQIVKTRPKLGSNASSRIDAIQGKTLSIIPKCDGIILAAGSHNRGNIWFLNNKTSGTVFNIGSADHAMTIEGYGFNDNNRQFNAVCANESTGTMNITNVTFSKFRFGVDGTKYGYVYANKVAATNSGAFVTMTDVTISNCQTDNDAFINSINTNNDAICLKGAFNMIHKDDRSEPVFNLSGRIKLGDKTSNNTYNDFTASNKPLVINWKGTTTIGTNVVVKVPGSQATGVFDLADESKGLVLSGTDLRLTQAYTLDVSEAKASTLILPFESTIPVGITAYTLNYTTGASAVTATEVTGGSLAANTPVLINAEEGAYKFVSTATSGDLATGSDIHTVGALTGVYAETTVPGGSYILTNHDGSVGFRKAVASSKVKAYCAYLTASAVGSREFLDIDFSDGNVTAIKNVKVGSEDHVYYDLQGRRVLYPKKGLYIVNGKKVIIK